MTRSPVSAAPVGHWLSRRYLAWDIPADAEIRNTLCYTLYSAPTGGLEITAGGVSGGTGIRLTYRPEGLPRALARSFPGQAHLGALRLPRSAAGRAARLLRGQLAVVATDGDRRPVAGAALLTPGVIDDVFAKAALRTLGISWKRGRPSLALWAPTAKAVRVRLYDRPTAADPVSTAKLSRTADGVWSIRGRANWVGRYYLYEVEVYVPETGRVETNLVTDPYSVALSANSTRSQVVNLAHPDLRPDKWGTTVAPLRPVDLAITELHLRDFSASDPTVPAAHRGTYLAFTDDGSNAVGYLRSLAAAGMTAVHLLPLADMATVDEDKSTWASTASDLSSYAPDGTEQQAWVTAVSGRDAFNWGYDPLHWTVPEGSYATDPEGAVRTREFREMVEALHQMGQRVVMDVVYNHTHDAGQAGRNNLDRIVPGYYHRLGPCGAVETSTCCPNTATEHLMMGKLMIDSTVTWATQYRIDGFRFDLMGHQPKALMLELRARLDGLSVGSDGVSGKQIYLYGEGWDFGEVANDALFTNATQRNMAGSGIGTFNDRLRDAVRGGGPFDSDPRIQGFASGLFTDPNTSPVNGTTEEQRARLLLAMDQIKVGLAGNLESYAFVDRDGAAVTGAQVPYDGSPAGYARTPADSICYVDAHDNECLYDALAYKLPAGTSMSDRIRMQTLALATTALAQGVCFWQAGSDALRSKSFDANSFDSGDWFNLLDPSLSTTGFGRGLPPSSSAKWAYAQPLLADPALKPTPADLASAEAQSQTLLAIRSANPLLRLGSARLIRRKLTFPIGGTDQTPGVIVMRIDDTRGRRTDPRLRNLVVIFNATPHASTQTVRDLAGHRFTLDERQRGGSDPVVKASWFDTGTGAFNVPARTVAVFAER